MRLVVCFLALVCLVGGTSPLDETRSNVIKFYKAWDTYTRELFGCTLTGEIAATTCHVERGVLDYAAYLKARRAAQKVFDVKE